MSEKITPEIERALHIVAETLKNPGEHKDLVDDLMKESLRETPGYKLAVEELVFPTWAKHIHSGNDILKLKFCKECGQVLDD
jgi:hypothetical protein